MASWFETPRSLSSGRAARTRWRLLTMRTISNTAIRARGQLGLSTSRFGFSNGHERDSRFSSSPGLSSPPARPRSLFGRGEGPVIHLSSKDLLRRWMDAKSSPGMTTIGTSPPSRGTERARAFASSTPSTERGRRECRAIGLPAAPRAKIKSTQISPPQVRRNNPAFPARWFYGFLRTLSGDRALLPPSLARSQHRSRLNRRRGVRTTRLRRPRHAARLARPPRPSHPAPHVRDDRETPLYGCGTDWLYCCLPNGKSKIFFAAGLDTNGQISRDSDQALLRLDQHLRPTNWRSRNNKLTDHSDPNKEGETQTMSNIPTRAAINPHTCQARWGTEAHPVLAEASEEAGVSWSSVRCREKRLHIDRGSRPARSGVILIGCGLKLP